MSILDLAQAHTQDCHEAARGKKPIVGTGNWKKKVVSESMAVHPDQIPEAIAECKKRGVAVPHFDEHGRQHFDNSRHLREYAKRIKGWRHYGY